MLPSEGVSGQNLTMILEEEKNYVGSKKVKNICLNSSVANTDRPIISKTNDLEETLNDANRVFESSKECSNAFQSVQKYRLQNPKDIAIGHLNVNSLGNKFEAVEVLVQNTVNICFLSWIKIDEAFPNQRIMINGYKLFRRDRNCHCGGVTTENKNLEVFMNSFGLACLIKKPLCFQSKNPISIDLILTNKKIFLKILVCQRLEFQTITVSSLLPWTWKVS